MLSNVASDCTVARLSDYFEHRAVTSRLLQSVYVRQQIGDVGQQMSQSTSQPLTIDSTNQPLVGCMVCMLGWLAIHLLHRYIAPTLAAGNTAQRLWQTVHVGAMRTTRLDVWRLRD